MTVQLTQLQITEAEFQGRCDRLLEIMEENNLSGVILFRSEYIRYYTGFAFIPTERPIAFVMNKKGERGLFVPRLEKEHAEANALIDYVHFYSEYPDKLHPMTVFMDVLSGMNIQGNIGTDGDGYPLIFGYRGANLSALGNFVVSIITYQIENQMIIKSTAEIELLKESSKWANLALYLLQKYTAIGKTETEVTQLANFEATRAMLGTIGPIYKALGWQKDGAYAEYRGQIGRNASIPHALANNIVFQEGDVLVGESTAPVWGYVSELERTMIIGSASDEQKRFFEHMLALQELAFDAIKPGEPCSSVDEKVRAYYKKHDLLDCWRHHTGHAIGTRYHEGPFLDIGDNTILKPGMVFTVEPGLYRSDLGGFRHSDTVVVTDNGIEIITFYPHELTSLII